MNVIASESSVKKHHAVMTLVGVLLIFQGKCSGPASSHAKRIGSVDIHWTTHQPRGLTGKDISMARYCENGAPLMGAVEPGQGLKCK